MAYKIRLQKKKEVGTLKVASRSEERLQELLARPKLIWGSLVVIVLVVAASFTWRAVNQDAEEAAWTLEAEASKLLHEPPPLPEPIEEGQEEASPTVLLDPIERLKRSAELYNEILEKYPTRGAAPIARLESANAYYALESYDQAEERLLSFLDLHPDRLGLVRLAHIKLAYLYLKKDNRERAKDHFRTVYEMSNAANKDQAGFELARILEAEEKVDEALAIYTDISTAYSQSPWGTEAKVRLSLLNPPNADAVSGVDEPTSDEAVAEKDKGLTQDAEEPPAEATTDKK